MRRAGKVVAEMHDSIRAALRPGVTTAALDRIGRDVLERRGARSNFLGYHGFPAVICASPNDVIVHGIPGPYVLHEGDIVSIDCGAIVDGWHGDAAFTAGVGTISAEAAALIEATDAVAGGRDRRHAARRAGCRDIGAAVQAVAEQAGFSVVRGVHGPRHRHGHARGPGRAQLGQAGQGRRLGAGQTYAVEPMVCAGRPDTAPARRRLDAWSPPTGAWAAHAEHTIAITDDGPEILTR